MISIALILIGLLVSLVLVHEFGHFIVAKLFGIKVDEFSIFFPPRLISKKFGETKYTIGLLPLGGYVKIFGENPSEIETPNENSLDKKNFSNRSRWIQAAVIVAGITFNILFAWIILSAGYMVGIHTSVEHQGIGKVQNAHVTVLDVLPGSPAEKSGIKANDIITSIQTGTATLPPNSTADQTQQFIFAHQDESMVLAINHASTSLSTGATTTEYLLTKPADGIVPGHKALGIELDDVGILKLSPPLALVEGAILTKNLTVATWDGFASLISQAVRGRADLSGVAGPIGIARIGSSAVTQGFEATIILTALVSINLAIINLLPIPGLDGGRLLFIAIEGIRRRALPESLVTRITIASFVAIGILFILITYHDIISWLHPV
jgi:regulator of sigma E protease